MNVFRDSTATLLDRIHRLERENARLRRRDRLRFRDRVFGLVRSIAQLLAMLAVIALVMFVVTLALGILLVANTPIAHG